MKWIGKKPVLVVYLKREKDFVLEEEKDSKETT